MSVDVLYDELSVGHEDLVMAGAGAAQTLSESRASNNSKIRSDVQ